MGNVICLWWLFDISRYWICSPVLQFPHFVSCCVLLHLRLRLLLLLLLLFGCLAADNFDVFSILRFLLSFFIRLLLNVVPHRRLQGATSVPESQLTHLSPVSGPRWGFYFLYSQILFSLFFFFLLVFCFLPPWRFWQAHHIYIDLAFVLSNVPETSWNASCISSRFDVALKRHSKAKLCLQTFFRIC